MLTDIRLNPNTHDIDVSLGSPILNIENGDEVAQRVKIALLMRLGEWDFDVTTGVPYLSQFLPQKNSKSSVDQFMVDYIASIDGVNAVVKYDSAITTGRQLVISVTVRTDDKKIIKIEV